MANYVLQKVNKLKNWETDTYRARFDSYEIKTTDAMIRHLVDHREGSEGQLRAALASFSKYIAEQMREGNTVRIDGVGDFIPTLKMDSWKEVNPENSDGSYIHVEGLRIDNVKLRADKELIRLANTNFHPTRSRFTETITPQNSSENTEERKQMLVDFLQQNRTIRVAEYIEMTGLKHTAACKELNLLTCGDDAILEKEGHTPHIVYKLKK